MSIILLSAGGPSGLSPRPPLPPEILERGDPVITGHTYHSDSGVSCVVWGATPYRIRPKQRPDFEFSILLEGEVVLTAGDGTDTVVSAGDAFVLPPSFTYQWGQTVPVLKFAVSFTPARPAAPGSVFTPIRLASLMAEVIGASEQVLFEEPTGRFRVIRRDFAAGAPASRLEPGQNLVKVLKGSVSLAEEAGDALVLEAGQAAFVPVGEDCQVSATPSARLLICNVGPES